MRFKVFRQERGEGRYDDFEMEVRPGMTVLDVLLDIQSTKDASLSFRYSCHWAVCGSCAMLINGVPRLACRTQVSSLGREVCSLASPTANNDKEIPLDTVLVEPLPNVPVVKDLVVDMAGFFHKYRTIRPRFDPLGITPQRERLMERSDVRELEKYTNCIMCGVCYGACPVNGTDPEYLGPAALAKLYRFAIDPREGRKEERLRLADVDEGWWGCRFYSNCRKVCPKGVPPDAAIAHAHRELIKARKSEED